MRLYSALCIFIIFISCSDSVAPPHEIPDACVDIDGNVYKTVVINNQTWMAENLRTTRFNDGAPVPPVDDSIAWCNLVSAGYCWHGNDSVVNKNRYGALYNWYALESGKLAPKGWHIPKDSEWIRLTNYLGGWDIAGGKLRDTGTTYWIAPNNGATNETGFSALPGDSRSEFGAFGEIGNYGIWWSSTAFGDSIAWCRVLNNFNTSIYRLNPRKRNGFSIRCVRDTSDNLY
jgi:uncharacterized protein (TIGR02145 family)